MRRQPTTRQRPALSESDRLQQIERVRHAILQGGGQSATDALGDAWDDRAWLERSWRRCLAQGYRPDQRVGFDTVSAARQAQLRESHRHLLSVAQGEMERLARAVAPIRYFAILTDAQGIVVGTAGAIDRADAASQAITRVGVDLSERSIGTSAIGAALTDHETVWLHRGEHFFNDNAVYSCAGAPLFGPRGDCVGMLDLTGVNVAERPELKHLVAQSARHIEDALALAVPHALCLRLAWYDELGAGAERGALLCLDDDGRVVSANRAARQMLPALEAAPGAFAHASDLFALPWGQLFDLSPHGQSVPVPLWSGLRVMVRATRAGTPATPGAVDAGLPMRVRADDMIHEAVRAAGGNVAEAARALGLSRATVYRRLSRARGGRSRAVS